MPRHLTYHLEYCFLVCLLNSDASVFDNKEQLLINLIVIGVDDDLAFEACVLDRVLNQIDHHLFHSIWVTDDKVR